MAKNKGIKFGLRKRNVGTPFWSVLFDTTTGKILGIEPGETSAPDRLVVGYAKVKNILSGLSSQENFRVSFDSKIGALDVVNTQISDQNKKKYTWTPWLTSGQVKETSRSDIKCVVFENTILRIEAGRRWATRLAENPNRIPSFSVYVTDEEDPHLFLGSFQVSTSKLIEKGFYETRLYSFMPESYVKALVDKQIRIRINMSAIADTMEMVCYEKYFSFTGLIDEQTNISHRGDGKHITIFLRDQELWAQSHYHPGSAIDDVVGNVRAGMFLDDPDNFLGWVEFPALMLRQSSPFKIADNWLEQRAPDLLYRSNNLDIGVLQ